MSVYNRLFTGLFVVFCVLCKCAVRPAAANEVSSVIAELIEIEENINPDGSWLEERLTKVSDDNYLRNIAVKAKNSEVIVASLRKINDEEILVEIAANREGRDQEREQALILISDKREVKYLIWKLPEKLKLIALEGVDDQKFLARASFNENNSLKVRKAARDRISDMSVYKQIVLEARYRLRADSMEYKALNMIQDNQHLKEISLASNLDVSYRSAAIDRIADATTLEDIYMWYENRKGPRGWSLKEGRLQDSLISKIEDQAFLKEMFKMENSEYTKSKIVEKIHDHAFLETLAYSRLDYKIKRSAFQSIKDSNIKFRILSDKRFLQNSKENLDELIKQSVGSITDHQLLKNIILDLKNKLIIEYAIQSIYDFDVLKEISDSSTNGRTRKILQKRHASLQNKKLEIEGLIENIENKNRVVLSILRKFEVGKTTFDDVLGSGIDRGVIVGLKGHSNPFEIGYLAVEREFSNTSSGKEDVGKIVFGCWEGEEAFVEFRDNGNFTIHDKPLRIVFNFNNEDHNGYFIEVAGMTFSNGILESHGISDLALRKIETGLSEMGDLKKTVSK